MGNISDIDQLLEEVVTLPSLPDTVVKITDMINDPNCVLIDVGKAISADPSLSIKTLRLVNSAYYGVREDIGSVEQAVVLLGLKVVKNLVYTASVFDSLQFGEEKMLRHCLACAVIMRKLVKSGVAPGVALTDGEEGFIYGLLHDVGKIILQQFMADDVKQIMLVIKQRGLSSAEAEREVIGTDHAEIGGRLAQNWKLSENLVNAISGHHDLSRCADDADKGRAALLAVADSMCYSIGLPAHDGLTANPGPEVWEAAGLTEEAVAPIVEELQASSEEINELASLVS